MASFDQELTIAPVPSRPGRWSEHAKLYQQVKQTGLLDRRCGYYAARISLNLILLAGGWAAFAVLGDSWWQLPADPPVLVQPLTGLPTRPPGRWELRGLGRVRPHDYLRLAWLVSALATTRSALGAAVESEVSCVSGLRLPLVGAHRTPTGQENHLRVVCSSIRGLPVTPNRIASPQGLG